MPELRQNIATREWVIIAPERARRPEDYRDPERPLTESLPPLVAECPFCPGNEEALARIHHEAPDGRGGWKIRMVANRFPALDATLPPKRLSAGFFPSRVGNGVHDVLIESPLHNTTTALLDCAEVALALRSFRDRGRSLLDDEQVHHVIPFKNHGPGAGTSLAHPHGQIIGVPIVPGQVRERLEEAMRFYDSHGHCVFCEMADQERAAGVRLLVENEGCLSFIPFAAFSPFHIWLIPKRHRSLFTDAADDELAAVADVLRRTLRKLYLGLRDPSFNYVIRMAPQAYGQVRWFHWYLSIVPKVSQTAGFELGSGMFINTSLPEENARILREVRE